MTTHSAVTTMVIAISTMVLFVRGIRMSVRIGLCNIRTCRWLGPRHGTRSRAPHAPGETAEAARDAAASPRGGAWTRARGAARGSARLPRVPAVEARDADRIRRGPGAPEGARARRAARGPGRPRRAPLRRTGGPHARPRARRARDRSLEALPHQHRQALQVRAARQGAAARTRQ